MSRTIIVSHKVPLDSVGNLQAGGLASAVTAAMEGNENCLWIGANSKNIESYDLRDQYSIRSSQKGIEFFSFPLTVKERQYFYEQMANEGLWPLMHELKKNIKEDGTSFDQYRNVNNLFAKQIKSQLRPDDIIWVHDYHLMPLASSLRLLGVLNPIMFFNHIPMPSLAFVDSKVESEELKAHFRTLIRDLFDYDLVGLQSFRDFRNFKTLINELSDLEPEAFSTALLRHQGRQTNVGVFPIGIETQKIPDIVKRMQSDSDVILLRERLGGKRLIIGADRLDYTKGLPQRADAISHFLKNAAPDLVRAVQFLSITPTSRESIKGYLKVAGRYKKRLMEINFEFGNEFQTPVWHKSTNLDRERLFAYYNLAAVGMVTSLNDGMQLGAKEFVAAQSQQDPGVLVLSNNIGAAEELGETSITYDPKDPEALAQSFETALVMTQEERIERHRRALRIITDNDAQHWAQANINELMRLVA